MTIKGRGVIGGIAEGIALVSRETIQGWSGLDDKTGVIIEEGHPFKGMSIAGKVLVLSGGKGSNGWSCHFHEARLRGIAPAAMIFHKIDSRTGVAAVVTEAPCVVDVENVFEMIHTGDFIRVNGNDGTIEIMKRGE